MEPQAIGPGRAEEGGGEPAEHHHQGCAQRERAVGRHHRQGVGGGEVLLGNEVRDRGLLRRRPQHRERLEHQRSQDKTPDRVDERQRDHHQRPTHVTGHHHPLAVPAIDEHAGDRTEEEARNDPGRQHHAQGGTLGPRTDPDGEQADRKETQPVSGGRHHLGQPEPEELGGSEHPHVEGLADDLLGLCQVRTEPRPPSLPAFGHGGPAGLFGHTSTLGEARRVLPEAARQLRTSAAWASWPGPSPGARRGVRRPARR